MELGNLEKMRHGVKWRGFKANMSPKYAKTYFGEKFVGAPLRTPIPIGRRGHSDIHFAMHSSK